MFRSLLFLLALVVGLPPVPVSAQTAGPDEFFEEKIRPLFANNCQACHNPQIKTGGLDLSTAEGFVHGGESGVLLNTENPAETRLLKVTSYDERLKMPPMGKLGDGELADLRAWVEAGAPWPGAEQVAKKRPQPPTREFTEEEKTYWAVQPMKHPSLPSVRDKVWVSSPIDLFILAKLDSGLSYTSQLKQRFPGTTTDIDAWMSFCRILMASNDFICLD